MGDPATHNRFTHAPESHQALWIVICYCEIVRITVQAIDMGIVPLDRAVISLVKGASMLVPTLSCLGLDIDIPR